MTFNITKHLYFEYNRETKKKRYNKKDRSGRVIVDGIIIKIYPWNKNRLFVAAKATVFSRGCHDA